MKKYYILLISILFTTTFLAQTNFEKGFEKGYKKGYCQDQGSCIEPISPVAPVPNAYESSGNFTDGYNRGFQIGLNARKSNSSNNSSADRTRYKTSKPKFVDDVMYKAPAVINNYKVKRANEIVEKGIYYLITLEDYDKAINEATKLFNMKVYYEDAYFIKSKAYFHKNELLNSYNYASKINSSNYKEWRIKVEKEFSKHIESLMSYNNYDKVIYNCENMWRQNNSSYYFTGLAYYFKKDYKKAKKYLKKVKRHKPAKQLIESIKSKKYLSNPYSQPKETVYEIDDYSKTKNLYLEPNNKSIIKYVCEKKSKIYVIKEVENSFFEVMIGGYTGYMTLENLKKINN